MKHETHMRFKWKTLPFSLNHLMFFIFHSFPFKYKKKPTPQHQSTRMCLRNTYNIIK